MSTTLFRLPVLNPGIPANSNLTLYEGMIRSQQIWVAQSQDGGSFYQKSVFISLDRRSFHQLIVAAVAKDSCAILTRTPNLPSIALVRRNDGFDFLLNAPDDPKILLESHLTPRSPLEILPNAAWAVYSFGEFPPVEGALSHWWSERIVDDSGGEEPESLKASRTPGSSLVECRHKGEEELGTRVLEKYREMASKAGLTKREVEIFNHLIAGFDYQFITEQLKIRERTVRFHARNIFSKLGAENHRDLLRIIYIALTKG